MKTILEEIIDEIARDRKQGILSNCNCHRTSTGEDSELSVDSKTRSSLGPLLLNCNQNWIVKMNELLLRCNRILSKCVAKMNYYKKLNLKDRELSWNISIERTWFGKYDSDRFRTIRTRFIKMKRLIGNKRVKIECKLNEFFQLFGKIDQNALASSSAGLKKINFFKPFATLPNKYKADYQAKTFIHEFAHLANANLFSTKYVAKEVYRAKALDLALNNPFRAVNNADNFGFYAICRFGNPSKGFKSRFCCGRPKDNNQDILCKILIG